MAFKNKSVGHYMILFQSASGQINHTVAPIAVKMMVVGFLRPFIPGAQVRMVDLPDPAFRNQLLEVAVNRCLV